MSKEKRLGIKLRELRKESGLSQFQVENQTGMAAGSLSRIESGKINPSKETIKKISRAIGIEPKIEAELFDLNIDELYKNLYEAPIPLSIEDQMQKITEINEVLLTTLSLDDLLQKAIDIVVDKCNLRGGVLLLREDNYLYSKTAGAGKLAEIFLKMLDKPLRDYRVSLSLEKGQNYVVDSVILNQELFGNELYDFTRTAFSQSLTKNLQRIIMIKQTVSLSVNLKNRSIGALVVCSREKDLKKLLPLLRLLATHLAIAIINAERFKTKK
ncbi:helix-turn-helix transcriptional regulator [Candidatus Dojkabacteria bacterium]|nr:helix-turn-helix transcriptional regulator [Candidatus Dojkabacteria bacterium]